MSLPSKRSRSTVTAIANKQIDPLVASLNLTPARFSLAMTHGWALARIDAAELDYRLFMSAIRHDPSKPWVPTADGDQFWHAAILETKLYFSQCETLLGPNRYIHHHGFVGIFGEQDARRQRRRYQESQRWIASLR